MNTFAIVAIKTYEVDTKAYFATTRVEAEEIKEKAEAEHGLEFAIFAR